MNITYHSWKTWKECPKKFYKQYIKKDPPTVPINEYFTLYGRLTEKFFEYYCKLWHDTVSSPREIKEKMLSLYKDILRNSTVNWTAFFCKMSQEEIFEKSFSDICNILNSENKKLFFNTQSEINIEVALKKSHRITGRLDFIHDDRVLFDGKGTNTIGKNIDNNQLLFYTLLYFFQNKKLPSKVGFFYFQFNTLIPVMINSATLNEFRALLSLDIKAMIKTIEGKATPSPKSCKYCNYSKGCLEYYKDKATRARPSKMGINGEGIINFGF